MRNLKIKKAGILIPLMAFLSLTSCGNFTSSQLSVEDVQYAYSSVFNTLNSLKLDTEEVDTSFGYGYQDIFDLYKSSDKVSSSPIDLDLKKEPFVELEYLKYLLDLQGSKFDLGKIYYDASKVDTLYFNMKTGEKDATYNSSNRYYYNLTVGADITTTNQGIINADVVFYNTYSDTSKILFTTTKYVNVMLNYNFDHDEPTYSLKIFTRNDQKLCPYIGYITYQYDYFIFTDGYLSQWREFSIESSTELTFDEDHGTFEDYIDSDFAYRVDAPKWYVGGQYYKISDMTEAKQISVGNTLFSLGLFEPFMTVLFLQRLEDPEQRESIGMSGIYSSVSNDCGQNLVYVLSEKRSTNTSYINDENNPNVDHSNQEEIIDTEKKSIGFYQHFAKTAVVDRYGLRNVPLKDLFIEFLDTQSARNITLDAYYLNKSGKDIEQIPYTDLLSDSKFLYTIILDKPNNTGTFGPLYVDINDTVKSIYEKFDAEYNLTSVSVNKNFTLNVYSVDYGVRGSLKLYFDNDLSFLNEPPVFPSELTSYGVPSWDGEFTTNYQKSARTYQEGYSYNIYSTNVRSDFSDYCSKLTSEGFTLKGDAEITSTSSSRIYAKQIDSSSALHVKLSYNNSSYAVLRTYKVIVSPKTNLTYTFPSALNSKGVPNYCWRTSPKFEFFPGADDLDADFLFVYDSNYDELTEFDYNLANNGYTLMANQTDDDYDCYRTYRTVVNARYYLYVVVYYYDKQNTDYLIQVQLQENPDYVEELNISTLYATFDFGEWNSSMEKEQMQFKFSSYSWKILQWEPNAIMLPGKSFKMVANGDWSMKNEGSSYDGYGYDDVENISSYSNIFSRGSNGEIVVINICRLYSMRATINGMKLVFTIDATLESSL